MDTASCSEHQSKIPNHAISDRAKSSITDSQRSRKEHNMFKKFVVFLGISALPALIMLGIPSLVVRFVSLSILFGLMFLFIYISPAGSGHVLDNALSFIIASVLLLVMAVVCDKALNRLKKEKEFKPSHSANSDSLHGR